MCNRGTVDRLKKNNWERTDFSLVVLFFISQVWSRYEGLMIAWHLGILKVRLTFFHSFQLPLPLPHPIPGLHPLLAMDPHTSLYGRTGQYIVGPGCSHQYHSTPFQLTCLVKIQHPSPAPFIKCFLRTMPWFCKYFWNDYSHLSRILYGRLFSWQ